ncbi:valine--tRNA ligase [Actinobacteria bacterium YIM 96077]|uniref:Valine--tRNA ligase n=1 Tax=Phytoactinopolyspora halophila TaxID=1981511 RepID=A0A329R767_9ACTN|nr:valine--tRNA ligase [Phytoactinopolyspora halophila]AYY15274.1 valine--tRNA ligase [Actinobacteria bacterium YIM 96077]RAW18928.1 valine--tRNA ligase [Phytoactinopolyspora halophila]
MTDPTHATDATETTLPTVFDPSAVEAPVYERWVERGYFEADDTSERPPFCIVIPPPNVTGNLHVGHSFEHTLIDALVRRRRMQGYEALWMPGMDHAGIATQNVVERELAKDGISRHDLGREGFIEKVWEWKEQSGGLILDQMRRLGDGVAWSRERFTMDDGLSRAVQTIFKRLYDDELIYQAERIINWCVRCQTALSDIEVEHTDDDGELITIRYGDEVVVATTRAETMLGDTAVAVHPDDERYRHLIGTEVELPLTGRMIPIIADSHVDPEFGTGMVKVTPAHDPNDFEIGRRHDLPHLAILDEQGVVTAPGPFEGLDRFEARPAIVAALREQGRVVAEKRPYTHAVGHCSRCSTVVEPRLSLQWWVKVGPLAKAAGEAVRDGRVTIHPASMESRWFDWVDDMHDWCISRQLWWGHRIPVWYGPGGEVICVGPDDEPPSGPGWHQDEDVLDTWFSSALWPFSTLGWPDDTPAMRKFYPNQVLVTGYDILFFWVARMMMFGLYANAHRGPEESVPFYTIALHGMVRDKHGKKMSKSFGNAVDPLEWMENYGSDALRFTLARGANPGVDVPIGEDWVQASRNFCNKLWNATRFAVMSGARVGQLPPADELSVPDRWILSRLHATLAEVDTYYEDFQFAKLCDALYHFAWDEFCDWYVELAKTPLAAGGADAERTRLVLGHVLDALLRALHPVTPFVTEVLWTTLTNEESVVIAPWPVADGRWSDPGAEAGITDVRRLVTELRRFRSDQGLKPGQRVAARTTGLAGVLAAHEVEIRSLTKLDEPDDGFTPTASITVGEVTVEMDLSGAVDVEAERRRLTKDLATERKALEQAERKLANEQFLAKAPDAEVEKVRARRASAEAEIGRIETQLERLGAQ